jgi:hypothetical protein
MYAQLVHCGTTPDRQAEMEKVICDRLMPALMLDPAFVGTLNLAHPTDGEAMLIVLWLSAEQAARPLSLHGLELRQALASIAALAVEHEPRPMVWQVDARV